MVAQPTKPRKPGTSIRFNHLSVGGHGPRTLAAAEAHGLREDASSQRRRIRDADPLVFGGLNLTELYRKHTDGCRMDKRMRAPVIHAYVQWPTNLPINEINERSMLGHARTFLNNLLGGEAVFAARLDRDEKGQHGVDVFCSPVVTKTNAKGVQSRWVQTTTHMKALCERHRAEIVRRHPKIKDITGKRQQGIALQSEWRAYAESKGLKLAPKQEKLYGASDWVTPEQYALDVQRRDLEAREAAIATQEVALEARQTALEAREAEIEAAGPLVKEAIALLAGDETPERQSERHDAEIAENGLTWEKSWSYSGNPAGTKTYWQRLRQHVSDWWRERIRQFGLDDGPGI